MSLPYFSSTFIGATMGLLLEFVPALAYNSQRGDNMDYITITELTKKWGITRRRICTLCEAGRIPGAVKTGVQWLIPCDAVKPASYKRGRKPQTKVGSVATSME